MKYRIRILIVIGASLMFVRGLCAQAGVGPYLPPTVLTKTQAQAQTKAQMTKAQTQYIGILERGFDQLSNLVTANAYHLTKDEVTAGFGDTFNAQVMQEGMLMLSTIIKANRILGRTDQWLTQDWVQAWIVAYGLDPVTGEAVASSSPTPAAGQ